MVSRFLLAADVEEHANVLTPYPAADCQTRTIFIANGVTLNTFIVKHPDAEQKPWIVLVNSLMTDYTMWDGVMARLSTDYNILAYDQRGHGKVRKLTVSSHANANSANLGL
jgi:pimeloyl-ACP methyl ester carboxylesterase